MELMNMYMWMVATLHTEVLHITSHYSGILLHPAAAAATRMAKMITHKTDITHSDHNIIVIYGYCSCYFVITVPKQLFLVLLLI